MGRLYSLAAITVLLLLAVQSARAQQPLILLFPDTPCDSISCASINVDGGRPEASVRTAFIFRDGGEFHVDSAALGADTIAAGEPVRVPVCFRPTRRGQITDSLSVVVRSGARVDTFRVRVSGRGVGPEIEPDPIVVNFPRTNPGSSVIRSVQLRNVGELPYTFDASSLPLSPPFQLASPGPTVIAPGDSIVVDIIFAPTSNGVYSVAAQLAAGCTRRLQLWLNGATDLIGTGSVLRMNKVRFNPENEEETPCSVTRCTPLTISNAGNAPLIVDDIAWAIDTAGYTIANPPTLPIVIPPSGQQTVEICLESRGRGQLLDTLVIRSNSRTSIAFGLVLDLSNSMDSLMSCGTGFTPTRISQAIEQGQRFIGRTLLHLPNVGVQDHLAIMRFSSVALTRMIFNLQPITDASRTAAQNILAGQDPDGDTQTGTALSRMMDSLMKSPLPNRVIVLLSDGAARDTRTFPADSLAARASRRGIRIFTIGIGTDRNIAARDYLATLAAGSSGQYFDGNDCGTLQQAFEQITDLVSRGQITREPFAMKVTSPMVVTSGDLTFDSTYYLTTSCQMVTLTNVGEGDAIIDSIALRDALGATTSEFSFGPLVRFPLRIPESGQTQVEICFRPTALRQRGGLTSFTYNSCTPIVVGSQLSGTGWARAGMRIDDGRVALPGSLATMPIHLDSTLAAYEVRTVTFQVRWNKSMLELRTVRPMPAAGSGSVMLAGPIRFEGREAVADVVATGDFLEPAGQLAELEFLVLRGDTLASQVSLGSLVFEDDNPKALVRNAGLVAFDSTCFRENKPVVLGAGAARLVNVDAAPIPATAGTPITVGLRADGESAVRVSLFSSGGGRVAGPFDVVVRTEERLPIATDGLPAGAYHVLVEEASGATHVRSVVVAE